MSGVFGVVAGERPTPVRPLMERMAAALCHRDWFVADYSVDEAHHVGLGRIGIGLFNAEPQPVWNEGGSVAACFSGELYRTAELRRNLQAAGHLLRDDSDVELILRLYEARGEQFIREVEGIFVLALWDRRQKEVLIANDRFGLYPLVYAHFGGKLVFAPEMKGILCDPGFRKALDLTALAEYVRFQHLLGDKTFFEDLKLLPNATLLRYELDADRLTLQPYWDFAQLPEIPKTITLAEAAEEAGRRLQEAVDGLTRGPHRLGVYLSGGVDSRVILGLIPRDRFPVTSMTFGLRGCRDVVYAARMAAAAGARHHYFEFQDGRWVEAFADFHLRLTEGFHSWIHGHGISLLPQARALMDVNLTGFGGGQSAIDWDDPRLFDAPDDLAFVSRLFGLLSQETTWPSINEGEERLLYAAPVFRQIQGRAYDSFVAELAKYAHLPYDRRAAYFALCNPDRRLFQYYTVFNRSHVEQHFPFYDYRYFEFVYALPPELLYKRRLRRAIIHQRMPKLARIPYDKDNLPITARASARMLAGLIERGKRHLHDAGLRLFPAYATLYADYENWLRRELRPWGEALLLGERTRQRGLFDPVFLRSLWQRHQSGLEVHTIGKLAPLMTYEMMLRRFYD